MPDEPNLLLTDLYMLTMLEGFLEQGMDGIATYEFFVRDLPLSRAFLMAGGLEQVLQYLENGRFNDEELAWLRHSGRFSSAFVDHLAEWRFRGDVDAMPEGTIFFANEPILQVTAPISQAQLVETRLINFLHFQTMIASKAARCVLSAPAKRLVDFGLRRAHGSEAGLLAARASYLAGFDGTATVLAAKVFGIPIYGTMAHAYIQAHQNETEAFESFARAQPDNVTLLIDTYDTEQGARCVAELGPRLKELGIKIRAVRLDSGDLGDLSVKVRRILDEAGLTDTQIFCSGNLDEYRLQDLTQRGAPIDGFGIGTRLDTSADAPYLDCAYKLVEYEGHPRRKRSSGKATWPGRKQVFRRVLNSEGWSDLITIAGKDQPGEALLQPMMRNGKRLNPPEPLAMSRERARLQLAQLPKHLRSLDQTPPFVAEISEELHTLTLQADRKPERAS